MNCLQGTVEMLICIKPAFGVLPGSPATWQVEGSVLGKGGKQEVGAEGRDLKRMLPQWAQDGARGVQGPA